MEYLVWLLSEKSAWLPSGVRSFLTRGMADWSVWLWFEGFDHEEFGQGLTSYPGVGALFEAISAAEDSRTFRLTRAARADLTHRIDASRSLLALPEPTRLLVKRFLDGRFIDAYFARRQRQRQSHSKTQS